MNNLNLQPNELYQSTFSVGVQIIVSINRISQQVEQDDENLSDESEKEQVVQTKASGYNIMVLDNKEPSKKDAELHFI